MPVFRNDRRECPRPQRSDSESPDRESWSYAASGEGNEVSMLRKQLTGWLKVSAFAALFATGAVLAISLTPGSGIAQTSPTKTTVTTTTTVPTTTTATTTTTTQATTTVQHTTTQGVTVTKTSSKKSVSNTPVWVWILLGALVVALAVVSTMLATQRGGPTPPGRPGPPAPP